MTKPTLLLCVFALFLLPSSVMAESPLGAPNTTLLLESQVLGGNQSNNLGPAASWVLENYWELGACPEGGSYELCDTLRFGAAVFNRPDCSAGSQLHIFPQEDGSPLVQALLSSNDTSHLCNQLHPRALADGLDQLQKALFPGLMAAEKEIKDSWFDHPHLTLLILSDLPQQAAGFPGDQVRRSLHSACDLFEGVAAEIPPMPIWTMVARKHSDEAVSFAGLLSAAGGTATCCDTHQHGSNCDPQSQQQILDVCDHITGRTDSVLRQDISNQRYNCSSDPDSWQTGALDFETSGNNLPQITCHLNGMGPGFGDNPQTCNAAGRQATDLFGKFSCIRQIPRHAIGKDPVVQICDAQGCKTLSYEEGDFEYIDAAQTLISIHNEFCDTLISGEADLILQNCPERGNPCDTGLLGRCANGELDCREDGTLYCEQTHFPMPEICTGRDDNCDGLIDNVDATIDQLPDDFRPRACYGNLQCVCPDGTETQDYGHDLMSFLTGQEDRCHCSPALRPGTQLDGIDLTDLSADNTEPTAACSSQSTDSGLPSLLWIFSVLVIFLVFRPGFVDLSSNSTRRSDASTREP